MPEFSVIVPTYNRLPVLKEALNSVWSQRFQDFEVIIVDDGSDDGTLEYLGSLGNRVKIERVSRKGPGAARNRGVEVACGDYVAFLDSDDLWFPWSLERFREIIVNSVSPPVLIVAQLRSFSVPSELNGVEDATPEYHVFPDTVSLALAGRFAGAGMMICNRSVFVATGGFTDETRVAEDHDFALRLQGGGSVVLIDRPVTLGWRRHPGSTCGDLDSLAQGLDYIVQRAKSGIYQMPISDANLARVLSMHFRPGIVEMIKAGRNDLAGLCMKRSFWIHVRARRWKFLAVMVAGFVFPGLLRRQISKL